MGLSAMPTSGNNRGNVNGNNGNGNTNLTMKREPLGNLFTADEGVGGPDSKRMRR